MDMERTFIDPVFHQNGRYLGSLASPQEAKAIMLGAPLDGTVSYWPGARFGPARIRSASNALEEYSPMLDRSLAETAFYDAGDVDIPLGNVAGALRAISEATHDHAVSKGKMPIVLGGEHLISLPVIEAVHAVYPDLVVLQFDAHTDLRETYLGETHSHATVIKRVCDIVGPQNVYQFGIRSGTREEFIYGREHTRFYPFEVLAPVRSVLPELHGRPIYITVDIDVIDPGFAPGTGTPEPGGCTPHDLLAALHSLNQQQVVGFDLVELCPLAESGVVTSVLAAKIVREAILSFV
jgi:agmatinase